MANAFVKSTMHPKTHSDTDNTIDDSQKVLWQLKEWELRIKGDT